MKGRKFVVLLRLYPKDHLEMFQERDERPLGMLYLLLFGDIQLFKREYMPDTAAEFYVWVQLNVRSHDARAGGTTDHGGSGHQHE